MSERARERESEREEERERRENEQDREIRGTLCERWQRLGKTRNERSDNFRRNLKATWQLLSYRCSYIYQASSSILNTTTLIEEVRCFSV